MTKSEMRVLIADSSPVYKKMFAQAIAEVAGNAAVVHVSGKDELLAAIARESCDIVVLDAEISKAGSAALIAEIKIRLPGALILFTAQPSKRNKALFADAAEKGAAVRLTKPIDGSYKENLAIIKSTLRGIVGAARKSQSEQKTRPDKAPAAKPPFRPELALIASSTGGPQALEVVLSSLSVSFPVPVLVVQHMLPHFTESFALNLAKKSKIKIKVAEDGEGVFPGTVYIAPDGWHMALSAQKRVALFDAPPVSGIRPTADALFESVAGNLAPCDILAVVLTGMGRDGEKGLKRLKAKHRCLCLAQSERTCVVYGMPRAAVESGLADRVLDLGDIASAMEMHCANAANRQVL